MPAVIPAAAAFFATAASTVASAVGLSAMTAAIGGAVGSGIMALGFASGIGAALSAWGTVFALGSAISTLTMKVPKPPSTGVQLDTKVDPNPARTFAFGRTAVGGTVLYQAVSGQKNVRLSRVIGLSVGPIQEIESFTAAEYDITWNHDPTNTLAECVATTAGAGAKLFYRNFRQGHHLGDPANATPPQTMTGTAMPSLTANSLFKGIAYAAQHLDYLQENFPTGDPKNGGFRWVLKGMKLYDPRKDSTYPGGSGAHRWGTASTYEWSENPAIVALNVALGIWQNGKKLGGLGAPITNIDVGSFVAAANVMDANGWKCGGEFSTNDEPYSVLSTVLQAGSATPVNHGGLLSCFINTPKTSIYTLNEDDVVGNIEVTTTTAWRDRKNTILPFWREESQQWKMVGGQKVTGTSYLNEDGGAVKSAEVTYPYCQSAAQAHQLAAYELVNTREFLQFTVTCRPRLLTARVGDCVTVQLADIAAPDQKCIVVNRSIDPQTWQVTLTLRAETDAKHDFALGRTGEVPPSPGLNGTYDGFNPPGAELGAWMITGTSIVDANGVVQPAIVIDGEADDPNAQTVICEYREYEADAVANANWISYSETPATGEAATKHIEITGVKGSEFYEAAISYRTVLGVITPRLILGPVLTVPYGMPSDLISDDDGDGVLTLRMRLAQLQRDLANNAVDLAQLNEDLANLDTGVPGFETPPATSDYAEGEMYFNTAEGMLYRLTDGEWVAINTGIDGFATAPATSGYDEGDFYFNTTNRTLYRLTGGSWVAVESAGVPGFSTAPATSGYKEGDTYYNTSNGKLYRLTGGVWKAIDADGVSSHSSAPAVGEAGSLYYNTTDGKLYRSNGSAWTAAVPAVDISGQVTNAQIEGVAASKVTGQLSNSQIAEVAAAKLTGTITETQISNNAVTTGKINAGAVTTAKIAAGAITADTIASNAITSAKIDSGAVTAGKLAAGAVTAGTIAAGAIVAGSLAAGSVTADELAANAVTADKIKAGEITGAKIAGSTITGSNIAGSTITGGNIAGSTISGDKIAGRTISSGHIVSGTITANEIAGSTITGSKIAGNTLVGGHIQSNTIASAHIQTGAIVAGHIGAGQITANHIGAGQIVSNHIGAGQIVANHIYAGSITAEKIQANNLAKTWHTEWSGYSGLAGSQVEVYKHWCDGRGGPQDIHCWVNCDNGNRNSRGVAYFLRVWYGGTYQDLPAFGTYALGGVAGYWNSTTFRTRVTWVPAGAYQVSLFAWVPDGNVCYINRSNITTTDWAIATT